MSVSDLARSRAFYEGVLGLAPNAPVAPDAYWVEYDIGSGTIGIQKNPDWPVSPDGMSINLEVED